MRSFKTILLTGGGLSLAALVGAPSMVAAASLSFDEFVEATGDLVTFSCTEPSCQFDHEYGRHEFDQIPGYVPASGRMFFAAWGIWMDIEATFTNPDPDHLIDVSFSAGARSSIGLSGVSSGGGAGINVFYDSASEHREPGDPYYEWSRFPQGEPYEPLSCRGYGTVTCAIEVSSPDEWPYGTGVEFTSDDIIATLLLSAEVNAAINFVGLADDTEVLSLIRVAPELVVEVQSIDLEKRPDDPRIVPLPPSLPIFASGLVALAILARRRHPITGL